jgi:hypothetical protein
MDQGQDQNIALDYLDVGCATYKSIQARLINLEISVKP